MSCQVLARKCPLVGPGSAAWISDRDAADSGGIGDEILSGCVIQIRGVGRAIVDLHTIGNASPFYGVAAVGITHGIADLVTGVDFFIDAARSGDQWLGELM